MSAKDENPFVVKSVINGIDHITITEVEYLQLIEDQKELRAVEHINKAE